LTRSKTRIPGFDRVTGLSGSKKILNQNNIVLVKKKISTGYNWVFDSQPGRWVTSSFSLPYFFFNPARFQTQIDWIPSRPVEPDQILKLCFCTAFQLKKSKIK
jgi:hypothetical protein